MTNILNKAKSIEEYIINFRRDLHGNPELSGQEFKTQKKIIKELDKLGIPYKKAGNTSLIATLKGSKSGKTIALRADFDALPVQEETDVEFKSKTIGLILPKYMGSEDMPYYFQHAKGVYAFIGYRNEEKDAIYFPHHEKFKIDEDYMKYGTALHV